MTDVGVEDGVAVLDQVEVERARAPAHLAGPAVRALDVVQASAAATRREVTSCPRHDRVEVCRLVGPADRVGLDDRRDASMSDQAVERDGSVVQRLDGVAEVGARGR